MSANPDEEAIFSLAVNKPKSIGEFNPRNNSDLDLKDKFSKHYAVLKHKVAWTKFVKWRAEKESGMNLYLQKSNEEFDNDIAELMKTKKLASENETFDYFLLKYSRSGARANLVRIDVILTTFENEVLKE
jgi:hypothetical protein